MNEANHIVTKFKNDRTVVDAITDTLGDIANWVVRGISTLICSSPTPYFFTTTTKPVDIITRDVKIIQNGLNEFIKEHNPEAAAAQEPTSQVPTPQ